MWIFVAYSLVFLSLSTFRHLNLLTISFSILIKQSNLFTYS